MPSEDDTFLTQQGVLKALINNFSATMKLEEKIDMEEKPSSSIQLSDNSWQQLEIKLSYFYGPLSLPNAPAPIIDFTFTFLVHALTYLQQPEARSHQYNSQRMQMNSSNENQPKLESMEEDEVYGYAAQLMSSSVLPMTLQAALELGIFDIIAKAGPDAKLSATEIAKQLSTKNPNAPIMLDRILRLLASHCVVACSVEGSQRLYSLTRIADYYVPDEDGVSLAAMVTLLQDKVFMASWSQLKDAVLKGGVPFDRVYGVHAFEYPEKDPRFNQVFNTGMINNTTLIMKQVLKSYKGFENLKQLVDVGGGLGVALNLVTLKYPMMKGINFDLPHVIQDAPQYPGVEHVGGDMFESVPKGDAIFMKWILHDWSDEHCLKLLKNCYNAIPGDGKVIVIECVLEDMPEFSATERSKLQCDVLMMTQNPGGKERTKEEFLALATSGGFSGIRFVCNACNFSVMEFYK